MDAAGAVDAQNAPTAPWKSLRDSHKRPPPSSNLLRGLKTKNARACARVRSQTILRPPTAWPLFKRSSVAAFQRSVTAVDFFTVETIWLQRFYVLFFIELDSRRVHLAGCTPTPNAPWVTQQARQLTWSLAERVEHFSFLIRDRDQKFTDQFDDVFQSEGIDVIRSPFRTPQANGVAERFVRTIRSECLDWLLILNQAHMERVLGVFATHYNEHRPHRALSLAPPEPRRSSVASAAATVRVHRRDRLGGVIREYVLAA